MFIIDLAGLAPNTAGRQLGGVCVCVLRGRQRDVQVQADVHRNLFSNRTLSHCHCHCHCERQRKAHAHTRRKRWQKIGALDRGFGEGGPWMLGSMDAWRMLGGWVLEWFNGGCAPGFEDQSLANQRRGTLVSATLAVRYQPFRYHFHLALLGINASKITPNAPQPMRVHQGILTNHASRARLCTSSTSGVDSSGSAELMKLAAR